MAGEPTKLSKALERINQITTRIHEEANPKGGGGTQSSTTLATLLAPMEVDLHAALADYTMLWIEQLAEETELYRQAQRERDDRADARAAQAAIDAREFNAAATKNNEAATKNARVIKWATVAYAIAAIITIGIMIWQTQKMNTAKPPITSPPTVNGDIDGTKARLETRP